jgi:hypothetical protein
MRIHFQSVGALLAAPLAVIATTLGRSKQRPYMMFFSLLISFQVFAQENTTTETTTDTPAETATEAPTEKKSTEKKMISEANISLRTTVTGNQEQPMVMYILPWQSPDSPEFDLEMQSSQADAVFGHIEREELNRQLDSAGELDEE